MNLENNSLQVQDIARITFSYHLKYFFGMGGEWGGSRYIKQGVRNEIVKINLSFIFQINKHYQTEKTLKGKKYNFTESKESRQTYSLKCVRPYT